MTSQPSCRPAVEARGNEVFIEYQFAFRRFLYYSDQGQAGVSVQRLGFQAEAQPKVTDL
jgi:hypothetical protein